MAPLGVSDGFSAFVLDQLSGVPDLRSKRMFGAIGLYSGEVFFGVIGADLLYFKTGDANRAAYVKAGSEPFRPYPDSDASNSYYTVPVAVLEDAAELAVWAAESIAVARSAKSSRKRRQP